MDFEEIRKFVDQHAGEDPAKLRLKFHTDPRSWMPLAINNIAALKARKKFVLRDGADLTPEIIPLELPAQQSTSANIALLHANLAKNSKSVLDMTFGLGMDARLMALEPLRKILGFDLQPELVEAARYNFRNFPNVEVRQGDSVEFLKSYSGTPFDLIFIDPARRGDAGRRLFNLRDCQPDLIDILPLIKEKSRRMIAKLSPMLDVTQTVRDLPGITELHIVEEANECKELLAVADFDSSVDEPLIFIDRLTADGFRQFQFRTSEERGIDLSETIVNRLPKGGEFIYEPSAAAMKSGAFGLLAKDFNSLQLHPNSHIYISPTEIPNFPGNCYRIEDVFLLSSSNMKKITLEIPQADVAVRNLKGFTADGLAKKMRIKPGGSLRILGTTVSTSHGDQPILLKLNRLL